MSNTQCKRYGCTQEGEVRSRYKGYCSLHCRDLGELEDEIAHLQTQLAAEDRILALTGLLFLFGIFTSALAINVINGSIAAALVDLVLLVVFSLFIAYEIG